MEIRRNAGYEIIDIVTLKENREIVLGKREDGQFVTWYATRRNFMYDWDYYHGHYIQDELNARIDFYERVVDELINIREYER